MIHSTIKKGGGLMEKVVEMENSWKIKYPTRNIYLMRNHNWAFSAWEIGRLNNEITPNARLLHVDFHDDYFDPIDKYKSYDIKTREEAIIAGYNLNINDFIKPAKQNGTIGEIYMVGDYNNPPCDVYHSYTYHQFENEHKLEFFSKENCSFILDLDLDFFNINSYNAIEYSGNNPCLYSEEYINKHLEQLIQYKDSWDLITVCISPEHCGGNEAAQYLLDLLIEKFNLKEENYIYW